MKTSTGKFILVIGIIGILAYIAIRVENQRVETALSTELEQKFEDFKQQAEDEVKHN